MMSPPPPRLRYIAGRRPVLSQVRNRDSSSSQGDAILEPGGAKTARKEPGGERGREDREVGERALVFKAILLHSSS